MKRILLVLAITFLAINVNAQCDCKKINRDDGTKITQCNPMLFSYDKSTQVIIAAASNGEDKFIAIILRFKSTALNFASELSIRLEDNNLISLQLINTQLAYIGNSQVAQGIYGGSNSDLAKLGSSSLKTVSFKLTDELLRTYQAKQNASILVNQIKCL